MKRIPLGIIIMAVLMLVGCNNVITNSQVDTTSRLEQKNGDIETATVIQSGQSNRGTSNPTGIRSSISSNYVKTYKDETHKQIQYGKLSFNIDEFHIVSQTRIDNTKIFKCKIDKGEASPETHMTIKVRKIGRKDFPDTKSIVSYLSEISPNYRRIRIYNNVTDASGIISLYSVTGGGLTNYIVCYKDACYLVESDYSILEIYLFKKDLTANYQVNNQKIKCANSNITHVNETISYNKNKFEKAEYVIIQGKGEAKYSAELRCDDEYQYHFTLKNEKGKKLLKLSTYGEYNEVIKILDVNMDGYADIQFLKQSGTMNNSYALYVWDNSAKNFVKVKCDEMLSYFEVHNGYLINWQKENANSGGIQKLVWRNKNTLIKESEKPYHAD